MRKTNSVLVIPIILVYILFSACSSMNELTMSVIEPAPVFLSSNIQSIGIINQSMPSEENSELDKIDRIFSLEGKELDINGAKESIKGLYDGLVKSNGFKEVKIIEVMNRNIQGSAPLSWEMIGQICQNNEVDVIFALSFYDTDATIDYQIIPVEIKTPVGLTVPAVEHHATISTLIKTGWRIYDPVERLILDDYIINDNISLQGVGINPAKAVEAVMQREEAVLQKSNIIGQNYVSRIFPYKVRVSRDYFVRGTDNFIIAKRRAQTGDWDGAAELWETEVSNAKSKVAGRACYNMAIINEINGNLDTAIDWASKSYVDYKNKEAIRYLDVLKRRVIKNNQLQK